MHRESCGGGPAGGDQLATGTGPEPRRSDSGDRPGGSLRGIPGPRRSPPPPPPPPPSPSLPRLEAERSGSERKPPAVADPKISVPCKEAQGKASPFYERGEAAAGLSSLRALSAASI